MLSLILGALLYAYQFIFANQMAKKREVSLRQRLLTLAAVLFFGPFGLLAVFATKRFSKYKGNEFKRKTLEYAISEKEKTLNLLKSCEKVLKRPVLRTFLPLVQKPIQKHQEQLEDLKAELKALGGKLKQKDGVIEFELNVNPNAKEQTVQGKKSSVLHVELTPQGKSQKQKKARDIYKSLVDNEGKSLSQTENASIRR